MKRTLRRIAAVLGRVLLAAACVVLVPFALFSDEVRDQFRP